MESASLKATEAECAAGRTAPRVSLTAIQEAIAEQYYFIAANAVPVPPNLVRHPLDNLTVCFLVMKNGFTIVGKAAPASPENFDAALGKRLAYEDAVRQCWPLMGFALRDKLATAQSGNAATATS